MLETITWDTILKFIQSLGLVKGIFVIFFFLMHGLYFLAMNGRLKDRQAEIDRITADNREYRERFLSILDESQGYKKPKVKNQ